MQIDSRYTDIQMFCFCISLWIWMKGYVVFHAQQANGVANVMLLRCCCYSTSLSHLPPTGQSEEVHGLRPKRFSGENSQIPRQRCWSKLPRPRHRRWAKSHHAWWSRCLDLQTKQKNEADRSCCCADATFVPMTFASLLSDLYRLHGCLA